MSTGQEFALSFKIDSGTWNTNDVRDWSDPVMRTEGFVYFHQKFTSVPTVIVSLSSVDLSHDYNCRVRVYATNINLEGFTVHADTWEDSVVYSCGISWLAIGQ
ncbi:hypothetical protein EV426DRAFT_582905 [Tirmania nivea]|nr:hypothetical protein EV426DRAFT_582905 [Tirmania nivea]